jgi:hypothetical protein
MEKRTSIQTKGIKNLFNEITAENVTNQEKEYGRHLES